MRAWGNGVVEGRRPGTSSARVPREEAEENTPGLTWQLQQTELANAKEHQVPLWEASSGTRERRYPRENVQSLTDKQTVSQRRTNRMPSSRSGQRATNVKGLTKDMGVRIEGGGEVRTGVRVPCTGTQDEDSGLRGTRGGGPMRGRVGDGHECTVRGVVSGTGENHRRSGAG